MKIRELYSDRSRWAQGALAYDKDGKEVCVNNASAASYCLVGAMEKCYMNEGYEAYRLIKQKIYENIGPIHMSLWNDGTTYEKVMELVTKLDL